MRIPIGNVHIALLGLSIPAAALGLYAGLSTALGLAGGSDLDSSYVREGGLTAAIALGIALALGGAGWWQARRPSSHLLVERDAERVTLVRAGEAPVSCSFLALGPVQLVTRRVYGHGRRSSVETRLFAMGLGRASVLRALTDGQAVRRRRRILNACRSARDPGVEIRDRLLGVARALDGDPFRTPADRSVFDGLARALDQAGSALPAHLQTIDVMLEDPDLRLRTAAVKLVAERPDVACGLGIHRLVHFLLWRPGYHQNVAPAGFVLEAPTLRDGLVAGVLHVLAAGDEIARDVVRTIVERGYVDSATTARFEAALRRE